MKQEKHYDFYSALDTEESSSKKKVINSKNINFSKDEIKNTSSEELKSKIDFLSQQMNKEFALQESLSQKFEKQENKEKEKSYSYNPKKISYFNKTKSTIKRKFKTKLKLKIDFKNKIKNIKNRFCNSFGYISLSLYKKIFLWGLDKEKRDSLKDLDFNPFYLEGNTALVKLILTKNYDIKNAKSLERRIEEKKTDS